MRLKATKSRPFRLDRQWSKLDRHQAGNVPRDYRLLRRAEV